MRAALVIPICMCVYATLCLVDWQAPSPLAWLQASQSPGPNQNTRPAAVRDSAVICPFCPLKIVVHCQLKKKTDSLPRSILTPHRMNQVGQHVSLFRPTSTVGTESALMMEYTSCLQLIHYQPSCCFNISAGAQSCFSLLLMSQASLCLCHVLQNKPIWNWLEGTCKIKTTRVIRTAVRHLLTSLECNAVKGKQMWIASASEDLITF